MADENREPTLVVGVGASAGGLQAFKQLLDVLPNDSGMAFLLVQHLAPAHKSLLAELLAPHTSMPVLDADHQTALEPNTVYIIRPDTALAVRDGHIELSQPQLHRGIRLPVNHLFQSLAQQYGTRAVGIVLSGAGSDGSGGLRALKSAGGLTLAQNPDSGGQRGMPASAVDTGVVDLVLEIEEMPDALRRFARMPREERVAEVQDAPGESQTQEKKTRAVRRKMAKLPVKPLLEDDLTTLSAILDAQSDFDLRVYKSATIERRVIRRMMLAGFDEPELYFDNLRQSDAERRTLVRDLLISVTDFFRDTKAFDALRSEVIESWVTSAKEGDTFRAWVPGCATGEEAFSIAMEVLDAIERKDRHLNVQVFATDVDEAAIQVGRSAIYPTATQNRVPDTRLRTFFRPLDGHGYKVRQPLRDVVSFAIHDITRDPPFSRMDLVSCRNVLIYLTTAAQAHVLKSLHFALRSEGALFLGTSESTGPQRELFSSISKPNRLYRKLDVSRPLQVARSRDRNKFSESNEKADHETNRTAREPSESDLARRAVVASFAPPTLVVGQDGSIVFSHGELDPYVKFPQGEHPRFELSTILRPEIATRVRGALFRCRRDHENVSVWSGVNSNVRVEARLVPELGEDVVLIAFQTVADQQAPSSTPAPDAPKEEAVIGQLERELQATREDLRNTAEELETSNEELRSSNEESLSMNEELQSANEELEATTEELRSLNEELTTVNAQLREKIEHLELAHDDLNNFFASTNVATMFLDHQLRIKRFSPSASELLGVDFIDIGRRLGDIPRELLQHGLRGAAENVLETLAPSEKEIQEIRTPDGQWYTRQVLPYRTENRRIEGVVVTFTDITMMKNAAERLELREKQQSAVARIALHALRERELSKFLQRTVRDIQETLQVDACKVLELQPGGERLLLRAGVGWLDGLVGSAYVGTGRDSQAGHTLHVAGPVIVEDLDTETRFSGPNLLVDHGIKSGISCVLEGDTQPYGVLGAHSTECRVFSIEDANFMQLVAGLVSSAIARHNSRTRLSLEAASAQAMTENSDLESALSHFLDRAITELGETIGQAWWKGRDGKPQCFASRATSSALERAGSVDFAPGERLASRVLEGTDTLWCTDVADAELFHQFPENRLPNAASAFGFPILQRGKVVGAITLFSAGRMFASRVLLRSLAAIGRLIGEFALRFELEARAQRTADITQSSHDAIVTYDADGIILQWFPGAERAYGYAAEEMVGESMEQFIPEDELTAFYEANERLLEDGALEPFRSSRLSKDGQRIPVSVRLAPAHDRNGAVVGISSTARDVSRIHEFEEKLLDADRHKDQFIAMLGHELRNPLAAIRSATEVMKLAADDPDKLTQVRGILDRQGAHMASLIDGLLDVSRIARGKIELRRELVDVVDTCHGVIKDSEDRVQRHKHTLDLELPDKPVWVEGDGVRIAQVIDNLLSNAIKYTPDGGTITMSLEKSGTKAVLRVKDTGIGIDDELMPHIFESFRQSEQSFDRSGSGLGLGLALSKALVDLHDGELEAHSEGSDKGSVFTARFPITNLVPAERMAPAGEPKAELEIVVIEDNQDAAETLKELLELSGHEVWLAETADEGIGRVLEVAPDIILCDLGLPGGKSGFDAAKEIRQLEATKDTPMIAVTGYGEDGVRERCLQAGFNAYLTKPLDFAKLKSLFSELL